MTIFKTIKNKINFSSEKVGELSFKKCKIRCINIENLLWFMGVDIAKALGYKDIKSCVGDCVSKKYIKTLEILTINDYDIIIEGSNNIKKSKWINEDGLYLLLLKSRQPKSIDFAKKFNINAYRIYNFKEQEIINNFIKFFKTSKINYETQYIVGKYRLDCYLPTFGIVIEVDENGHNDRCRIYEKKREEFIKNELSCRFFRLNPDSNDFDIFSCLGKLNKLINKQLKYKMDE